MTWALCLNCGQIKLGAFCPCPGCQIWSTGDKELDMAFCEHTMAKETLEELGAVVKAIHRACDDEGLRNWAFLLYASMTCPNILTVKLKPDARARVEGLLGSLELPSVTMRPGRNK